MITQKLKIMLTVAALAFAAQLSAAEQSKELAQSRPNIIYLMSDDQDLNSVGCYGNPEVQTPNMDKLAADGMVFDKHYVTTAICMASRASVMTGMYEYKHGTNFGHGHMREGIWKKSYPVLLREGGYQTAFAGKFGFEIEKSPGKKIKEGASFDRWAGVKGMAEYATKKNPAFKKYAKEFPHSTLAYGAFGRDFIRDAVKSDKPFCLSISFKAPHRPTTPDPRFNHIYKDKVFTKPANYGREHGEHFSKQSKQGRQYKRFIEWGYKDKYDQVMAVYYQQIYAIDVAIGMIRDELKKTGADKNTVIIYTSDNGFFCGSHGYGSKVLPYEESTRVPMIIFDPRHSNSGKKLRCDALTGNIDFAPTILALAGLPVPENMDGENLFKLYDDPKQEIHESLSLINVFGAITKQLAVVTKDYKYIHWAYAAEGFEPTDELYNLGEDRLELVNQSDNPEYRTVLERMQKTYDAHLLKWRTEGVKYNKYDKYVTLFDRSIPWSEKKGKW